MAVTTASIAVEADTLYPYGVVSVPEEGDFSATGFLSAADLQTVVDGLIERERALEHLQQTTVSVLWRKRSKQWGRITQLSGMIGHYADAGFAVWLSAEKLRDAHLSPRQLEALLYHHLLRVDYDDEKERFTMVDPDIIAFDAEIERYGFWSDNLKMARVRFAQLALDIDGDEARR